MKQKARELQIAIFKQTLLLATGGFSLVAALAWNEAIKGFIDTFIKPYLPAESGVLAQLIYAGVITVFAVVVTIHLGKILAGLEEKEEKETKIRNAK
jgi:hypothetical protein